MLEAIIPDIIKKIINNRQSILWKVILAIGVFFAIYSISKIIIKKIREKITANSLQDDIYTQKISKLSGQIIFIFLMIFNILAVFQVIGFNTAIIMGWISISLWFAMETTIGNMIAGIMVITNKKIKIGKFTQFLGKLNIMWTIEEITIRYCVIRLFDKRRVIVPNNIMVKTPIKTFKTEQLIRGEFKITVPRYVNIEQIQTVLNKIINENPHVLRKEYTSTIITGFNFTGINMKTFFFINPQKKSAIVIIRDLRIKIMQTFKKYGIKRPYPHITLTAE
jgi:small-conductance mechanosensitive channel